MAGQTTLRVLVEVGRLRGVGLDDIVEQITESDWSDANPPWKLQSGESQYDNIRAGVPVYQASNYSSSTDVWTLNRAIEAAISTPGYVDLGESTRVINTYQRIGTTDDWRGYYNAGRKILGWIGVPGKTFVDEGPNMIPAEARDYALNPTVTSQPVPLQNLYFSTSGSASPFFMSGITFRGRFQGPYGPILPKTSLTFNANADSPIPHRGLALWGSTAGARLQFCRFQGFSYTVKASPPHELGMFESNNDNGLVIARCELDGRLPTGERSGGGDMINYGVNFRMEDSWVHHTRRSGVALHEHSGGDAGNYTFRNTRVENIANGADDGFPASQARFNALNVEGMTGRLTLDNTRFARDGGYHVSLGTTAATPVAKSIDISNFRSLDPTWYNGCFVIRIIKNPTSGAETSAYWNLYQSGGLAALPFHVTANGVTLTPVAHTAFNANLHRPDRYYVVVTS